MVLPEKPGALCRAGLRFRIMRQSLAAHDAVRKACKPSGSCSRAVGLPPIIADAPAAAGTQANRPQTSLATGPQWNAASSAPMPTLVSSSPDDALRSFPIGTLPHLIARLSASNVSRLAEAASLYHISETDRNGAPCTFVAYLGGGILCLSPSHHHEIGTGPAPARCRAWQTCTAAAPPSPPSAS